MKTIIFAGLPNTGKSSWINKLSGSHLSTGNWNGVTVEKHEAELTYQNETYKLIDLPGITGFHHRSDEERIAEDVLLHESIDCIVFVMDACHMKTSLRLFMELRKFQIPLILLINFKDEALANEIHIDTEKLFRRLSCPIVYGTALNSEHCSKLFHLIQKQSNIQVSYRPLLNPEADRIFEKYAKFHSMKNAIELFERHHAELSDEEKEAAVDSCMRFVSGNMKKTYQKTLKLDRLILCSFPGRILFLSLTLFLFLCLICLGMQLSEVLNLLFDVLIESGKGLFGFSELMDSFVNDVLFSGMKSLIGFVPILMSLSLFHVLIEESGLLARICVVMDGWMRCFGLTGKSFLCFLTAHGCNVPAVIQSTSLEDAPIRKKTALLVPFCSCSARFAVMISFVNLMFEKNRFLVFCICYGLGLFLIFVFSLVLELFHEFKISPPDLIEMPCYRRVNLKILWKKMILSSKDYLKKVVKVLLFTLSVIWLFMHVPFYGITLYQWISILLSRLYVPLGFGKYWGYAASLLPGFIAKEAAFGTLVMIQKTSSDAVSSLVSTNFVFLVYLLTTIPCILTLFAQRERYGLRFACMSALFSFSASYVLCWMLVQFIMFF